MTGASRSLTFAALLVLRMASVAVAAELGDQPDRHPLAPADTSSPRATLQSFLDTIPEFEQAFLAYRNDPGYARMLDLVRIRARAVRVFDLSAVPPAAVRQLGGQAAVLLWEVLARLELPP